MEYLCHPTSCDGVLTSRLVAACGASMMSQSHFGGQTPMCVLHGPRPGAATHVLMLPCRVQQVVERVQERKIHLEEKASMTIDQTLDGLWHKAFTAKAFKYCFYPAPLWQHLWSPV